MLSKPTWLLGKTVFCGEAGDCGEAITAKEMEDDNNSSSSSKSKIKGEVVKSKEHEAAQR